MTGKNFFSLFAIVFCIFAGSAIGAQPERNLAADRHPATERRIALVIGNAAYPGAPLANPVNDARDMAAALRMLGFDVIELTDVTQREMNHAIARFGEKLRADTVALFYYAGHGMQVKGKNYLIPVDAQIQSESSARVETVDVDGVLDQLSVSPLNIVILDACRNNPFERRFRSISGGLAQMDAPKGTLIAYATAPGKVAADGAGRNGMYTQELLKHLQTPGLPLETVLKRVRNGVMAASGDAQTPWESSSLTGDFYFIPGAVSSPPAGQQVAANVPSVTAARTAAQIEDELWNTIKDSDKASVFEAYLKEYPKGRYAALARVKLAGIKEGAKPSTSFPGSPVLEPASKEDAETSLWKAVEIGNNKDDYEAYLVQYPTGKYAALARSRIKRLEDHAKQEAALKAESELWQKASSTTDNAMTQTYLDRYPSGRYVVEARTRLAEVKRAEAELKPGKVFKDCPDCPEMVAIPAGSFDMGSNGSDAYDDEKPVHHVTLVRSFALGRTEVTQGQWKAVMGNDPPELRFKDCGTDCPVDRVSWNDAQEFIRKLNEKTGMTYRLPTEAEWEYACKAGGNATYCGGESIDRVAWYGSNSGNKTHPVAGNQANAWGLYDMSGNVWEWVEDCWHNSFNGAPADGSAWTSSGCENRIRRGGSWISTTRVVRATIRGRDGPAERYGHFGFRLARTLP